MMWQIIALATYFAAALTNGTLAVLYIVEGGGTIVWWRVVVVSALWPLIFVYFVVRSLVEGDAC